MKIELLGLLFANSYTSLGLMFYKDVSYYNFLGPVDVNVDQCVYVGDKVNDKASSARWGDAANYDRCICFHDHYPCSGRTRCWDESNRFFENFNQHDINGMVSGVSLYERVPNLPCSARNKE
ncbi:hypothetical protein CONCODRAFT_80687 [Conidiobolus coronatus NRRL 28638]|uniref:Uncharacterized protein n=1 Tax=Conidiobolus coronatus (strain ATCC 28846 / CBS 209.66 / NRRL 28638) TaxID=796925 RepID=A0A137NSP5_CONC2|nr:hypothetical protein CONCODRAFT_80687 [Conidiobolus coronatus NRRL 28638]|eukprot:KXN65787.1 hypothetical protein CONCODRAFT_80687 [Conidiobolus coronatus NRRL 28638]